MERVFKTGLDNVSEGRHNCLCMLIQVKGGGFNLMKLSFELWPNYPYQMHITGVVVNSWGNKPIRDCVEKVAYYGYKGVDFIDKMFFDLSPQELERTLEELSELVKSLGITVASVGSHHLAITPWKYQRVEQVKSVKKGIDIAAKPGAPTVVSYIDGYYNPPTYILLSRKEAKQIFVDMVRECAEYAGEKGIDFSVEPHQETLINLPDITLELIQAVGLKNVKVTIDFGGLYLGIKPHMSVKEAISQFGSLINHVHAKDIAGTIGRWNMCWFGAGIVNFKECAEALRSIGYKGFISVEWEGWFKGGIEGVGDLSQSGLMDFDRVAVEAKEFLEVYFSS